MLSRSASVRSLQTKRARLCHCWLTVIVTKQALSQTAATKLPISDCLLHDLLGHLFALTICRLPYVGIVLMAVERMEEQQEGRAKGAMLTTAEEEEEEEAGSFHSSRLLSFCFLAISFCSF